MKNNSINNSSIKFTGVNNIKQTGESKMTLEDKIIDMIKKVSNRSEREVPEYGDFKPVVESINVNNPKYYADKFTLKVFKMPQIDEPDPKERYIQVSLNANKNEDVDMLVKAGYKDEIINELKSKEFVNKMFKYFRQLEDVLKHA